MHQEILGCRLGDFSLECRMHALMAADLLGSGDLKRRYIEPEYPLILEAAFETLPAAGPGEDFPCDDCQRILRVVRRREMARIAFRDLAGWSQLDETMSDLSRLADACLEHALKQLYPWHCGQYGTPTGPAGTPQQLVVLAMIRSLD